MAHAAEAPAPAQEAELQPGDHVYWKFGVGQARGQVVEKITENKKLGSRLFKASPSDPKFVVKSDSSGKEAIRKPETLHKIDDHEVHGKESHDLPPTPAKRKQRSSLAKNGHANADADHRDVDDAEEVDHEAEDEEDGVEDEDEEHEEQPKKAPHVAGRSSARENAAAAKKAHPQSAAKDGKSTDKDEKKGEKGVGADLDLADADADEDDTTYDPTKDLEAAGDAEADEAAFDALPVDEKLLDEATKEGSKAEGKSEGKSGGGPQGKDVKAPADKKGKGTQGKDVKPPADKQGKGTGKDVKPPANKQSKGASKAEGKGPKKREAAKSADIKNREIASAAEIPPEEKEEDTPYDPQQDAEDVGDVEDDEAALDALPADEELIARQEKGEGGGQ